MSLRLTFKTLVAIACCVMLPGCVSWKPWGAKSSAAPTTAASEEAQESERLQGLIDAPTDDSPAPKRSMKLAWPFFGARETEPKTGAVAKTGSARNPQRDSSPERSPPKADLAGATANQPVGSMPTISPTPIVGTGAPTAAPRVASALPAASPPPRWRHQVAASPPPAAVPAMAPMQSPPASVMSPRQQPLPPPAVYQPLANGPSHPLPNGPAALPHRPTTFAPPPQQAAARPAPPVSNTVRPDSLRPETLDDWQPVGPRLSTSRAKPPASLVATVPTAAELAKHAQTRVTADGDVAKKPEAAKELPLAMEAKLTPKPTVVNAIDWEKLSVPVAAARVSKPTFAAAVAAKAEAAEAASPKVVKPTIVPPMDAAAEPKPVAPAKVAIAHVKHKSSPAENSRPTETSAEPQPSSPQISALASAMTLAPPAKAVEAAAAPKENVDLSAGTAEDVAHQRLAEAKPAVAAPTSLKSAFVPRLPESHTNNQATSTSLAAAADVTSKASSDAEPPITDSKPAAAAPASSLASSFVPRSPQLKNDNNQAQLREEAPPMATVSSKPGIPPAAASPAQEVADPTQTPVGKTFGDHVTAKAKPAADTPKGSLKSAFVLRTPPPPVTSGQATTRDSTTPEASVSAAPMAEPTPVTGERSPATLEVASKPIFAPATITPAPVAPQVATAEPSSNTPVTSLKSAFQARVAPAITGDVPAPATAPLAGDSREEGQGAAGSSIQAPTVATLAAPSVVVAEPPAAPAASAKPNLALTKPEAARAGTSLKTAFQPRATLPPASDSAPTGVEASASAGTSRWSPRIATQTPPVASPAVEPEQTASPDKTADSLAPQVVSGAPLSSADESSAPRVPPAPPVSFAPPKFVMAPVTQAEEPTNTPGVDAPVAKQPETENASPLGALAKSITLGHQTQPNRYPRTPAPGVAVVPPTAELNRPSPRVATAPAAPAIVVAEPFVTDPAAAARTGANEPPQARQSPMVGQAPAATPRVVEAPAFAAPPVAPPSVAVATTEPPAVAEMIIMPKAYPVARPSSIVMEAPEEVAEELPKIVSVDDYQARNAPPTPRVARIVQTPQPEAIEPEEPTSAAPVINADEYARQRAKVGFQGFITTSTPLPREIAPVMTPQEFERRKAVRRR